MLVIVVVLVVVCCCCLVLCVVLVLYWCCFGLYVVFVWVLLLYGWLVGGMVGMLDGCGDCCVGVDCSCCVGW